MRGDHIGEVESPNRVEAVRDMRQRPGLALDRLDEARVAMLQVVGCDAGDKIEVLDTLVVPHPRAFATHQRDVLTAG